MQRLAGHRYGPTRSTDDIDYTGWLAFTRPRAGETSDSLIMRPPPIATPVEKARRLRIDRRRPRIDRRQLRIDSRRRWFPDLRAFVRATQLLALLSRRDI